MKTVRARLLTGLLERTIGLIGKKRLYPVYLQTRYGIHTFGVLSPLDILVLDKNGCVVKIGRNIPPNSFFFWLPKYNRIIELPAGHLDKQKIEVGDSVQIIIDPLSNAPLSHL